MTISLDIIVIGAGLGGLSVAYILGKAGHRVTILEAATQLGDVGAGIQLSPNMTRLLERWGVGDRMREVSIAPESISIRKYSTGELIGWRQWGATAIKDHGAPYYHVHRADLHEIMVDMVKPYATIRLNARVVDLDPSAPSATLQSGEIVHGDLIIGADGLHSKVRDILVGHKDTPMPTGEAVYRVLIPTAPLRDDPELKSLLDEPALTLWLGPERHIVGYPIRKKEIYNLVLTHVDRDNDESVRESTAEIVQSDFADFEPRIGKLVKLVKPPVLTWSLMERTILQSWVHPSGKLCVLGDSCHAMLPHRAQGAAMSVEDAAVLGNLLSRITDKSQLLPILKAYQDLRLPRVTEVQDTSRMNRRTFHLPNGEDQERRDASMRIGMREAQKEARGEKGDDCVGNANMWSDKKISNATYNYDADVEVENWCASHWECCVLGKGHA